MKVEELASWNPWWVNKRRFFDYYNFSFLAFREVAIGKNVIIRGPRQVGKTLFLLRSLSQKMKEFGNTHLVYISADRLGGLSEFREIIRELREVLGLKIALVIDEAPSFENWEKGVKEAFELGFSNVWVSGSRPISLEKPGEYFPGRCEMINFYPLSFREFLLSMLKSLESYRVVIGKTTFNRDINKFDKLKDFCGKVDLSIEIAKEMKKIIERNRINLSLKSLKKVKKLFPYSEIIARLFRVYLETGGYPLAIESYINGDKPPYDLIVRDTFGTIEKEGLSRENLNLILPGIVRGLGVSMEAKGIANMDESTLSKYLVKLERAFLVRRIYKFDGKVYRKKARKHYFIDPFIAKAIAHYYGIRHIDEGQIVENVVVEAISRFIEQPFLRDASWRFGYGVIKGKEVDVVTNNLKIEIKYRGNPKVKGVDVVLTKDTLSFGNPFMIPIPLFLALLSKPKT